MRDDMSMTECGRFPSLAFVFTLHFHWSAPVLWDALKSVSFNMYRVNLQNSLKTALYNKRYWYVKMTSVGKDRVCNNDRNTGTFGLLYDDSSRHLTATWRILAQPGRKEWCMVSEKQQNVNYTYVSR